MPLVLTQNEVIVGGAYDWNDVEGLHYQYPNGYLNLVQPGQSFVYYRGVHRGDGGRRAAEYFGCGVVGNVWRDGQVDEDAPKQQWRWYCDIDEYVPFGNPVADKDAHRYLEQIGRTTPLARNHWRAGVRGLSDKAFKEILRRAGLSAIGPALGEGARRIPDIDDVTLPTTEIDLSTTMTAVGTGGSSGGGGGTSGRRLREPKAIGDRAEEIVYRMLVRDFGEANVVWRAQEGAKPGWDIDYTDAGRRVAVEVKGTARRVFERIAITANEWEAASDAAPFRLALVTLCLSTDPAITWIDDPADLVMADELALTPSGWWLERR